MGVRDCYIILDKTSADLEYNARLNFKSFLKMILK